MIPNGQQGGGAAAAVLALIACLLLAMPMGLTDVSDGADAPLRAPDRPADRPPADADIGDLPPGGDGGPDSEAGAGGRGPAAPPPTLASGGTRTFDLTIDRDVAVWGAAFMDEMGSAMATGDIDGDGKDDIVVSAPKADAPGDLRGGAGEVYLYFGDTRASLGTEIDMATDSNATYYGATAGDNAGHSLAAADLNADGKDDIIIGVPYGDGPGDTRSGCGEVYVIYGDTRANMAGQHDLGTTWDAKVIGSWTNGHLGWDVAVGDVIGSAEPDLVMGSPDAASGKGSVFVADGDYMPSSRDFTSSSANLTISGNATGDDFGSSVACGDADGDGKDDMLIGAPAKFVSANSVGAAYLILGGALATPINLNTTTPDLYMPGVSSQGYAGIHVEMGDMDNDGKDDMIVSAPGAMGGGVRSGSGEVYINFGASSFSGTRNLQTSSDAVVWGAGTGDGLGSGIALGDVDGDGKADLLMGASKADGPQNGRNNCGEGYLLFGDTQSVISGSFDLSTGGAQHMFHGVNNLDETGSSAAVGDIDGDGFGDIMLGAAYANGPLNMRSDSGEVYVLYGEALTLYNDHCVLLDGYQGGTDVFAGYKAYTIEVNVTERRGPSHLSNVTITLGYGAVDIVYNWSGAQDRFSEVDDAFDVANITSASASSDDGVRTVSLTFNLTFNWTFPSEAMMTVRVLSLSDMDINDTSDHSQVFRVENDLDLTGGLTAVSDVRGALSDGDWVAGGESITFGGLTAVYEGTTDVFPPDDDFNITVENDDGDNWTDAESSGEPFSLTVQSNAATDTEDIHTIGITNIPGAGQDVSSEEFTVKVDADGPEAPGSIVIHADYPTDPEVYADDDAQVFVTWAGASDGAGSGVAEHCMAYDDPAPTLPNASGDAVLVEEGVSVAWVRARDNVGNWGEAGNASIIVDLDDLYFTDFRPRDTRWQTSLTGITVNVTIVDVGAAGVDGTTVAYAKSTDGPEGFTSWTAAPAGEDGSSIDVSVQMSFAEGVDNYFKWKATDLSGNGETESQAYNIKVDVTPVEWSGLPDETGWHLDNYVTCALTVTDEISGVDPDSVMYKLSTEGDDAYGTWTDSGLSLAEVEGGYRASVVLDIPDGDDNYIRWMAEDAAGTGTVLSSHINYLVDTHLVELSDIRPKNEPWYGSAKVRIKARLTDGASGVDPSTVSYALGGGPNLFGRWLSAGVEEGGAYVEAVTTAILVEGSENYIKWRAADAAGNNLNESRAVKINVDLTPPAFAALTPSPGEVQNQPTVVCGILVKDDFGSGVNRSTIQYSFSSSGTGGYGGWIDPDIVPATKDERHLPYWVEASIIFPEGDDNYVRWRAMDLVDNGYAVSADLNIVVKIKAEDEPPDIVISSPSVDSGDMPVYKGGAKVSFDAANSTDPEGADLDFYWESDIDGGLASEDRITMELSAGVHNITLWVDDGTEGHNTSYRFRLRILEPDDGGDDEPDDGGDDPPPVVEGPDKGSEEECGMLGLGCIFGIPVFLWLMIIVLVLAMVGGLAAALSSKRKREEEERKAKEERKKKKEKEKARKLATPAAFGGRAHAGGAYISMAGGAAVPAGYRQASGAQVAPLPIQVGYVPRSGSLRPYSHPQGPALQLPEAPYSDAAEGVGQVAGSYVAQGAPPADAGGAQGVPPAPKDAGVMAPPPPAPAPAPPGDVAGPTAGAASPGDTATPPAMSPPPGDTATPPAMGPPPG